MELYLFWVLWLTGVTAVVSFNWALLKYYTDPHEAVRVTLLIQVLAFSTVMVYTLLIPFDVFASVRHFETVVSFTEPLFGHHTWKVYDLYFLCYVCLISLCFVGLPFSYFYAQAVQESEDLLSADYQAMRGMDSSESSSDEEQDVEINLGQDSEPSKPRRRKREPKIDQPEKLKAPESESKGLLQSQFWTHSRKAI